MNNTPPPLLSIIIPVYNVGSSYLRPCLDSLLSQMNPQWEAICVDDGSTDESGAILDEYAEKDSRFIVVHKKNEGVSKTRNLGMTLATAPYLTMLDADDAFTPDATECIARFSAEAPDFILFGCTRISADGKEAPLPMLKESYSDRGMARMTAEFASAVMGFCCGAVYKVGIIRQSGIAYDSGFRWFEDCQFLLRYLAYCQSVYVADTPLYRYYARSGSASNMMSTGKAPLKDYIKLTDLMPSVRRALPGEMPGELQRRWKEMLYIRNAHLLYTPFRVGRKKGWAPFVSIICYMLKSQLSMMRGISLRFMLRSMIQDIHAMVRRHRA